MLEPVVHAHLLVVDGQGAGVDAALLEEEEGERERLSVELLSSTDGTAIIIINTRAGGRPGCASDPRVLSLA